MQAGTNVWGGLLIAGETEAGAGEGDDSEPVGVPAGMMLA